MTKSNNDWLDEILDKNLEDIVDANFNGYNYALNKTAKAAITSKINEMLEQARADVWQKIHTPYQKGQVKGQYKILEPVRRVGKNTKFKVECVDCGLQMFRYANKFEMNHRNCVVA